MRIKAELTPTFAPLDVGQTFMGHPIISTVPGSPQVVLDVEGDGAAVRRRMSELVAQGLVVDWRREKEDYTVLWLADTVVPSWGDWHALGVGVGDTFPLMNLTEAVRRRGRYGANTLVIVCDTGVESEHEAFADKDLSGDFHDSHGHGTHVASTAASAWGIASDAVIYSKAVLPNGQGTEAGIANGIRKGADVAVTSRVPAVMNLSLGGGVSSLIDDAVRYAQQRGVVVVAAAGNTFGATIGSPARAADLIVLAVDRQRNYAPFTSGTGWPNPNRVSAPGVDVVAANPRGGSMSASGTSMAAPHVTGAVALLLAAGYSPRAIREALS